MLGKGRFNSGHGGDHRARLEKPRKRAEAEGSGAEDVHLLRVRANATQTTMQTLKMQIFRL